MKKVKKRIEKKKIGPLDYILLSIFILLFIFVIYLLFRLKAAKAEYKVIKAADLTVPIIEKRLMPVKVYIKDKKKDDVITYKINITNYRNDEVNKKDFKYQIYVKPSVEGDYSLYNKDNKDVLDDKNLTKDIKLEGKKKRIDPYTLKLKLKEDVKEEEVIIYVEGKE